MRKDILGRTIEVGDMVMFDFRNGNGIARAAGIVSDVREKTISVHVPLVYCDSEVYFPPHEKKKVIQSIPGILLKKEEATQYEDKKLDNKQTNFWDFLSGLPPIVWIILAIGVAIFLEQIAK